MRNGVAPRPRNVPCFTLGSKLAVYNRSDCCNMPWNVTHRGERPAVCSHGYKNHMVRRIEHNTLLIFSVPVFACLCSYAFMLSFSLELFHFTFLAFFCSLFHSQSTSTAAAEPQPLMRSYRTIETKIRSVTCCTSYICDQIAVVASVGCMPHRLHGLEARMHIFSKNLGVTTESYSPEGWHEATSIQRSHKY